MGMYLLVWNPTRYTEQQFRDDLREIGWPHERNVFWACGNTKKIKPGDWVFLLRVGKITPGIVGRGRVTGTATLLDRYDGQPGTFRYIPANWDFLDFPKWSPAVPMAELEKRFPEQHWHPQSSGISVQAKYWSPLHFLVRSRRPFPDSALAATPPPSKALAGSSPAQPTTIQAAPRPIERPPDPAPTASFDPTLLTDARERVLASVTRRRGQPGFREKLLSAYGGRCAVSGCVTTEVLEAAHIVPYAGRDSDMVQNGLLLRSDLHTLFDLGRLTILPETYRIQLPSALRDGEYGSIHGKKLRLPKLTASWPSKKALEYRAQMFLGSSYT